MLEAPLLVPRLGEITKIVEESYDTKTFRIKPADWEVEFNPGQFAEITVFGVGEAPFALSSDPDVKEYFEVSVRAVGSVTNMLHKLKTGSLVGFRAPLGVGWPLEELEGQSITMVVGGTGIFAVSSLIWHIYHQRGRFGDVKILYGARSPDLLLKKKEFEFWLQKIEVHLTVDKPSEGWTGNVGVVTNLIDKIKPNPESYFLVVGPPIMMKFTLLKLDEIGAKPDRVYVSLERNMKCGLGLCGRCRLSNGLYVCKDGPIFRSDKIWRCDLE